jgi:hypothetical protein
VSAGEYVDGRSDGGGDLITAAGAASPIAVSVRWRPQVNGCRVMPVNRRAMTRRYKSSCRVNRWRSDADGVRLLDLCKSEATLDLSAMNLQLQLLEESATKPPWHWQRDCPLGTTPARTKQLRSFPIFAVTYRDSRDDDNSSPSDTSNTVKMPSNRLTYVRSGNMLSTEILTY